MAAELIITDRYLDQFDPLSSVTLVGPMANRIEQLTEPVIFVDGGSNWREGKVGVSVGDGDSSSNKLDVLLNPEKDFSDLSFALESLGNRFRQVQLCGFLGGRADHQLLNYGAVAHFLSARQSATCVWFEREISAYSTGSWQINVNGVFSLVVFEPTHIELQGDCKYHIPAATMVKPVSSFGLSNEGHGRISLSNSAAVFIFHNPLLT